MAQLSQIQVSFAPVEDRLLLRLSTSDNAEYRFWLTRRYSKVLVPKLYESAAAITKTQTPVTPGAQREVLDFQREAAIQQSDFKTPFKEEDKHFPFGDSPVLLTQFELKTGASGIQLGLTAGDGTRFDLALDLRLIHSLMQLVEKALDAADWELPEAHKTTDTPSSHVVN
ncbi:MAG: hypothetical protein AAF384_18870 [Pseudomonadota bacterium]